MASKSKSKYIATPVYDEAAFHAIQDAAQVPNAVKSAASEAVAAGELPVSATDASETMVFARQLETIKNVVYETQYAQLKGRSLVPMSYSAGPNAEHLTYRIWDETAMAMIVSNYATDFPLVAASAREEFIRFFDIGSAYGYSIQDLRKAAFAGVPLDSKLAMLARNSLEQALDEAIAVGVPQYKTYGMVNHPNVSLLSLTTGNWPTATGEQILADLNSIITTGFVNTLEIHQFDTLAVSTACYRLLSTKLLSATNSSNVTVLEAFLKQNPGVTVQSWTKLTNANASGNNGRIIAYKKNPLVLEFEMGSDMEVVGPIQQGFFLSFPVKMRVGGLALHQPLGMAYVDAQLV